MCGFTRPCGTTSPLLADAYAPARLPTQRNPQPNLLIQRTNADSPLRTTILKPKLKHAAEAQHVCTRLLGICIVSLPTRVYRNHYAFCFFCLCPSDCELRRFWLLMSCLIKSRELIAFGLFTLSHVVFFDRCAIQHLVRCPACCILRGSR